MSTLFCHLCGKQVTGRSKQFHHALWPQGQNLQVCPECLQSKPRCRKCNIPLAKDTVENLCVTCGHQPDKCLTCGKKVAGYYWRINGLGPYCDQCHRERPSCDLCHAPLEDRHWTLADGRVFCSRCHESGVFRMEEAHTYYAESQSVIEETLGLRLNIPTALILVDREQLKEVIRKQSNGAQDLEIDKTMGIYARRGLKRGIYVQTGLPRRLFLQIASHEIAHAWQGENCPLLSDSRFREGFAEWVAYRVLSHFGYQEQMLRMRNGNNIYSQGLQRMLDLESQHGIDGVLEACRHSR